MNYVHNVRLRLIIKLGGVDPFLAYQYSLFLEKPSRGITFSVDNEKNFKISSEATKKVETQ